MNPFSSKRETIAEGIEYKNDYGTRCENRIERITPSAFERAVRSMVPTGLQPTVERVFGKLEIVEGGGGTCQALTKEEKEFTKMTQEEVKRLEDRTIKGGIRWAPPGSGFQRIENERDGTFVFVQDRRDQQVSEGRSFVMEGNGSEVNGLSDSNNRPSDSNNRPGPGTGENISRDKSEAKPSLDMGKPVITMPGPKPGGRQVDIVRD